jgi:hypothetical protein
LRLAEQSRATGANGGIKEITNGIKELVGGEPQSAAPANEKTESSSQQKEQPKPNAASNKNRQNKP